MDWRNEKPIPDACGACLRLSYHPVVIESIDGSTICLPHIFFPPVAIPMVRVCGFPPCQSSATDGDTVTECPEPRRIKITSGINLKFTDRIKREPDIISSIVARTRRGNPDPAFFSPRTHRRGTTPSPRARTQGPSMISRYRSKSCCQLLNPAAAALELANSLD